MSDSIEQQPKPGFLDRLIEKYPTRESTIEVMLELGDVFVFRYWKSAAEVAEVRERARKFAEKVAKNPPPVYRAMGENLPKDVTTLNRAAFVAEFNIGTRVVVDGEDTGENGPPLKIEEWVQFAGMCPKPFDTVFEALSDKLSVLAVVRALDAVDDAKKKSPTTTSGDLSSEPAGTSGDDTQTNSEESLGTNQ